MGSAFSGRKKKPSDFCCFRCVTEQWVLTVIKHLRFFVLITSKDETPTSTNRAKCKRNIAFTHKWNIANVSYSVSIFSLVNANDNEI